MYIMISTSNRNVISIFWHFRRGETKFFDRKTKETYNASHLFSRKITMGTFLMDANKASLALAYDLQKRYPLSVEIFIVARYPEHKIPEDIRKEVEKCRKQKTTLKANFLKTLEKTKIRSTINLREVPSKSYEEEAEEQKKK